MIFDDQLKELKKSKPLELEDMSFNNFNGYSNFSANPFNKKKMSDCTEDPFSNNKIPKCKIPKHNK